MVPDPSPSPPPGGAGETARGAAEQAEIKTDVDPDESTATEASRISQQNAVNRQVQSRLPPELLDQVRRETEVALLGGERKYTRDEVSELTGVSLERTAALWTAMGFAVGSEPGERNYTDADVQSLRELSLLSEIGVLTSGIEGPMVRATA